MAFFSVASIATAALTFSGTGISGNSGVVVGGSGTISIGTSTATSIMIGNSNATTSFLGNVGIGTTGQGYLLNVGTSTMSNFIVGSAQSNMPDWTQITADGEWTQSTTSYTEEFGMTSLAYGNVNSGVTQNGQNTAYYGESFRNYFGSGDNGTLSNLFGGRLLYGHYGYNPSSSPQTNNVYGLFLYPYAQSGNISSMYDLYLYYTNG